MRQVIQRMPPARDLKSLLMAITPIIEDHGFTINQIIADTAAYTITNALTDRSYDANATTVDELADVLATLIADLKTKGVLS